MTGEEAGVAPAAVGAAEGVAEEEDEADFRAAAEETARADLHRIIGSEIVQSGRQMPAALRLVPLRALRLVPEQAWGRDLVRRAGHRLLLVASVS
jgi:hypothetical protein